MARIREVHEHNFECYGYPRVWRQLRRQGERVGRDHVARLMRQEGIRGAKRRGRPWQTTIADPAAHKRPDLVCRNFTAAAPDRLWVGDLTYLRTWEGRMYFAFIIDVFSRMIVGWSMADHLRSRLVLDALEMALYRRRPEPGLIHHSDQGCQGGFKRSSQHSIERGCDGQAEGVGSESDRAAGGAFAGAAARGPARASGAVLDRDQAWGLDRGGGC